jgi:hypothetical protein
MNREVEVLSTVVMFCARYYRYHRDVQVTSAQYYIVTSHSQVIIVLSSFFNELLQRLNQKELKKNECIVVTPHQFKIHNHYYLQ